MAGTSPAPAARHDSFYNNGRLSAGIVQQGTGNAARDLYNGPVTIVRDRQPKPPPSSTVPFRRDNDFVYRDSLDDIRQLCAQPAGCAALVGLDGVGKSQLAIEYGPVRLPSVSRLRFGRKLAENLGETELNLKTSSQPDGALAA